MLLIFWSYRGVLAGWKAPFFNLVVRGSDDGNNHYPTLKELLMIARCRTDAGFRCSVFCVRMRCRMVVILSLKRGITTHTSDAGRSVIIRHRPASSGIYDVFQFFSYSEANSASKYPSGWIRFAPSRYGRMTIVCSRTSSEKTDPNEMPDNPASSRIRDLDRGVLLSRHAFSILTRV